MKKINVLLLGLLMSVVLVYAGGLKRYYPPAGAGGGSSGFSTNLTLTLSSEVVDAGYLLTNIVVNGVTNIVDTMTQAWTQGSGQAVFVGGQQAVYGSGTAFTSEYPALGTNIDLAGDGSEIVGTVETVNNDTLLQLNRGSLQDTDTGYVNYWWGNEVYATNVYDLTNTVEVYNTNYIAIVFYGGSNYNFVTGQWPNPPLMDNSGIQINMSNSIFNVTPLP